MPMRILLDYLEKGSPGVRWLLAGGVILLLGYLNRGWGTEFRFSIFYLIPIAALAWTAGRQSGILASLLSIGVWLTVHLVLGEGWDSLRADVWNALSVSGFFLVVAILVAKLREVLDREKVLARTDPLTGVLNIRALYEAAQTEIDRARRHGHPTALAYLDVDDLKICNDRYGHAEGDRMLQGLIESMKSDLRKSDILARVGGDEFVIVFPETPHQAALQVLERVRDGIGRTSGHTLCPATISVSLVTWDRPPTEFQGMIRRADAMMYAAKKAGKNRILHESLSGVPGPYARKFAHE